MDIYHKEQSIFPLTWLMVKRHIVTGLLYFCKTTRTNPYKYNGSGKYWCRHLKIYGKTIETIWCQSFDDRDDLIEFATFFSEVFDIVNSKDINGNKLWANLEVENGITGMPPGTDRGVLFKEKAKVYNKGTKNPSYGSKWWNNGNIEIRCKMKPEGEEWCQGRIGLKEKINKTKILNNTVPVGSKNPRYDHRIHTFYNTMSGLELQCTQYEFRKKLNLERKNVNGLVNGSKKIYLGWIIKN